MNKNKYKVRRIRTLQAILRVYANIKVKPLGVHVKAPAGFDAVAFYRSIGRRKRWHPRRGVMPPYLTQRLVNTIGHNSYIMEGLLKAGIPPGRKIKSICRAADTITHVTTDAYVGPINFTYDPQAFKNLLK